MELEWQPVEWDVTYPVNPNDPIGRIRLERDEHRAWLGDEDLGRYLTPDAAAEAVWERFLEANRVRHAAASVTHGGRDRHQSGKLRG